MHLSVEKPSGTNFGAHAVLLLGLLASQGYAVSSSPFLGRSSYSYPEPDTSGSTVPTDYTEDADMIGVLVAQLDAVEAGEGEHAASAFAIQRAKALLAEVEHLVQYVVPDAGIDFYYGELGIEWRKEDRILRLTCFKSANEPPRLDYGTMSRTTPGEYRSDRIVTPEKLAERLKWLSGGSSHVELDKHFA